MKNLAAQALNWKTPYEALTGSTPDVSVLMQFHFWEPVYYMIHDKQSFPSQVNEKLGRIVGISENVGDSLTYIVLTDDTKQIIHRSSLRSAQDPKSENKRIESREDNNEPIVFIRSTHDSMPQSSLLPDYSPDALIGRKFIKENAL